VETQNVMADKTGHYTVQLGSSKSDGLPLDLFTSGEARWLGVQVSGQAEQPRVLLLSVPYALKAGDAETVGGLPPSAFVLAAPASGPVSATGATADSVNSVASSVPPPPATITGAGTVNFVPLFTGAATIGNSALFQSGASSTAKIGINTNAPATTLDVKGAGTFRGALALPATAPATAAAGKASQPLNLVGSSFNSVTGTPVDQTFRLQTEPLGNNTSATNGTLNLLYASGANTAVETGLKIASNGRITFAAGQTFPGTGPVKSVGLSAPASDFTVSGSPVVSPGTLNLAWKVAPTSADTANAIVKRDSSGNFSAGNITAGGVLASTSVANADAVQGIASSGTGVVGQGGYGVLGGGYVYGVVGQTNSGGTYGVVGQGGPGGVQGLGTTYGVFGQSFATGVGVWGESDGSDGLHGVSHGAGAAGAAALNDMGGDGILAVVTNGGFAGFFVGDVDVDGNLSKAGGSFKIDHPLDPADKYLYHSFVESPDMMNIYNGNVTTDAQGTAIVTMPDWFEALNGDFRYQLTVIGTFAQAIVASEIANGSFSIKTDKPNVKVSWQVTGVRQDAWANAHRIPVEQVKPERERGFYLHPELFGAPEEKSIAWARHPETMKRAKEKSPLPPPFTKH
jgi:hypothetical protein